jgi:HTH-type transcriptional regulator/antitoxin HigA
LDIAKELAAAFGTSVDYWMNLEKAYQQFLHASIDDEVVRRKTLFELAPIKDMIKRNWIPPTKDWRAIEQNLLAFLDMKSIQEQPRTFAYAAKKANASEPANPAQRAWLIRAMKLARGVQAAKFTDESFATAVKKLKTLMENSDDIRHVPKVLAEGGVRFLIVENIAHAKMDGACFWLDNESPVIVMGIRYDRIDNFWYVLGHESGHVKNRDGVNEGFIWDANLVGDQAIPFEEKTDTEKRADSFAQQMLIDQEVLEDWIGRTSPLYSKAKIMGFARLNHVHPAIVLGQLQYRHEVDWSHSREMLVKIRHLVAPVSLTDGFGHVLPATA